MAILDDHKPRIILPRWRNANSESSKFILQTEIKDSSANNIPTETFLQSKLEFKNDRTFSNALEVINSGFSLNQEQNAIEEAKFILSLDKNLPSSLKKILNLILKDTTDTTFDKKTEVTNPHLKNIFKEAGKNISKIRQRLVNFPHNPLLWLELSRLYSILGNINKAESASQVALQLSKNSNRLITRSVSRFYVHKQDFGHAQSIVRKSPYFFTDPWLIAADISYSQFLKRLPTSIKIGKKMVESKSFSNSDITELAAALGTQEYFDRSIKEGQKYFHKSLQAPNENSFAQVDYFLEDFKEKNYLIDKIDNNFEAQSLELRKEKKYEAAFAKSFKWLIDQPFSRRAAYFNSYLLCGIIENFEKAVEIGKFSLRSNPKSFLLNNNIAYSYAQLHDIKNANYFLKRMKSIHPINDEQKIIILATEGLIKFKEKKIVEGQYFYRKAIEQAEIQKNKPLKALALIHFAREEYDANSIKKDEVFKIISNLEKEGLKKGAVEIHIENLNRILTGK
jgi:tetratricopeptide (TPR) repeat protein